MSEFTVEQFAEVAAPADVVWRYFVEARRIEQWWGHPGEDITSVAQQLTLRTGSSSYYRLWVESIVGSRVLEFTSAHLGVATPSHVRLEVVERGPDRAWVSVSEALRSTDPAAAHQAGQLWSHRLERLAVAAGSIRGVVGNGDGADPDDPLPMPQISDITARCTLVKVGWRPLHSDALCGWLPLSGPELPPRSFFVVDSAGPRPFPIRQWHLHYDDRIHIGIEIIPGEPVTAVDIAVTALDTAIELSVTHRGWAALDVDAETREILRDRFAATWRHVLQRAAQG